MGKLKYTNLFLTHIFSPARSERGFSLIEMMVAAGLGVTVLFLVGEGLVSQTRVVFSNGLRMDHQGFEALVAQTMSTPGACKRAIGISDSTPVIAVPTGSVPSAGNPDPAPFDVTPLTLGGTTYAPGASPLPAASDAPGNISRNFFVSSAKIKLRYSPDDDGSFYAGTLELIAKPVSDQSLVGGPLKTISIPLILTLKSGETDISGCRSTTQGSDPKTTCADLGGRWIFGKYIPEAHCNASQEIVLNYNEYFDALEYEAGKLPAEYADGIPDRGGVNAKGERVEYCKYQSGNIIQQYKCPGRSGRRAGYRCWFDIANTRWLVSNFNSSGTPSTTPTYSCTSGVVISRSPDTVNVLDWNEPLEVAFKETGEDIVVPSVPFNEPDKHYNWEWDRIGSVRRCNYVPNADNWFECTNSKSGGVMGALLGKINSCLYVENVKLQVNNPALGVNPATGLTSYRVWFNQFFSNSPRLCQPGDSSLPGCDQSVADYTGWIRVWGVPADKDVDQVDAKIRGVQGLPCYQVEVDTEGYPEASLTRKIPLDRKEDIKESWLKDPGKVRECVFKAPDNLLSGTMRNIVYTCNNGDPVGGIPPITTPNSPTAADMATLADWVGLNGDTPRIKPGSCWYFQGVRLAGFGDAATGNSSLYPTGELYTGWAYLTGNLYKDRFKPRGGALHRTSYSPASGWILTPPGMGAILTPSGGGTFPYSTVDATDKFSPGTNFINYSIVDQSFSPYVGSLTASTEGSTAPGSTIPCPSCKTVTAYTERPSFYTYFIKGPTASDSTALQSQDAIDIKAIPCNAGIRVEPE